MGNIYIHLNFLFLGAYIMLMGYSGFLFRKSQQVHLKYMGYIMDVWAVELVLTAIVWSSSTLHTPYFSDMLFLIDMMLFPTSTFILHVLLGKETLPLRLVAQHEGPYMLFLIGFLFFPGSFFINVAMVWSLVYCCLVVHHYRKRINKYHQYLYENYSNTQFRDFRWLKRILLLLFVFAGAWAILVLFSNVPYARTAYILLSVILWFNVLHHIGLHQMTDIEVDNKSDIGAAFEIGEEEIARLQEEFNELCHQKLVFQNPDISIQELSMMMNTNRGTIIAYIRHVENTNFFMFINRLRIQYAEKQLAETMGSMDDIARKSGYTSLASFRAAFSLFHNISPLEYREAKNLSKKEIERMGA